MKNLTLFASTYNSDVYGASTYQNSQTTTTTSSNNAGGLLANTGYEVLLPVALGIAILGASLVLFIKKTRRALRSK